MAEGQVGAGLVRILKSQPGVPQPTGAGFLVSERHVLTCAHVVNRALGRPTDASSRPDVSAYLDFPHLERHPAASAIVLEWYPVSPEPTKGTLEDIAVLELEQTVPGSDPLPLVSEASSMPLDYRGHAFGFPESIDDGEWGQGKTAGEQGAGWVQLNAVGDDVPAIRAGYSGAAFLDQAQGRVLGMVVGRRKSDRARLTYVIPVQTLLRAWPDLDKFANFEALPADPLDNDHAVVGMPAAAPRPELQPTTEQPATQAPLILAFELNRVGDDDLSVRALGPQATTANVVALTGLKDAVKRGDFDALYRFLRSGSQNLAAPLTAAGGALADPQSTDRVVRLRLVCSHLAAAELPWHRMTYNNQRLGDAGWVVEVLREAERSTLDIALDNPLIVAPADPQLEIQARPHANQVAAHIHSLLSDPATKVQWARTRRELDVCLAQDPDLIYIYSELSDSNSLILGKDEHERESLHFEELLDCFEPLRSKPLLWLHLVEPPEQQLNLRLAYKLTRYCYLVLVQRTTTGGLERSLNRTLDWLQTLHDEETEPAAVLSRQGDPETHLWLGAHSVRLRRSPGDGGAALYAHIRAALIRILLGRQEEKRQLRGGIEDAREGTVLLYGVTGDLQACVHDFPDQAHHYLRDKDPRVRIATVYVPFTMRMRDRVRHELETQLKRDLHIAPGFPPEAALRHIAMVEPLRDEILVVSLPWLLEPAEDFTPEFLEAWLVQWRDANLGILEREEIPPGYRVLVGACVQWPEGWLEPSRIQAEELQRRVNAVMTGDDRGGSVEAIVMPQPLGSLDRRHVTEFYRQKRLSDRLGTQAFNPEQLATFVHGQTAGRFQETVDLIYWESKLGYPRFQKSQRL